jgi:hypothetical protein
MTYALADGLSLAQPHWSLKSRNEDEWHDAEIIINMLGYLHIGNSNI